VKAEEEICLAVVGGGRTLVESSRAVVFAGQNDAKSETHFEPLAHAAGEVER
jgi:hypothetical protein